MCYIGVTPFGDYTVGKPKMRASAKRYKLVAVRLTPAEFRALRRAVAGQTSLGGWVRALVLKALEP